MTVKTKTYEFETISDLIIEEQSTGTPFYHVVKAAGEYPASDIINMLELLPEFK